MVVMDMTRLSVRRVAAAAAKEVIEPTAGTDDGILQGQTTSAHLKPRGKQQTRCSHRARGREGEADLQLAVPAREPSSSWSSASPEGVPTCLHMSCISKGASTMLSYARVSYVLRHKIPPRSCKILANWNLIFRRPNGR